MRSFSYYLSLPSHMPGTVSILLPVMPTSYSPHSHYPTSHNHQMRPFWGATNIPKKPSCSS